MRSGKSPDIVNVAQIEKRASRGVAVGIRFTMPVD